MCVMFVGIFLVFTITHNYVNFIMFMIFNWGRYINYVDGLVYLWFCRFPDNLILFINQIIKSVYKPK